MDILKYQFMQNAIVASIFGGLSCSLVGVLVVTLGIPFLGVAVSHAALAGAILGIILKINPFVCAFIFSCLASLFIGPVSDKARFKPEVAVGILFSIMLGLIFLFLAFLPGAKTEALSLLWGSILTISHIDVAIIILSTLLVVCFLLVFFRYIKAVLFNRQIAASLGIPEHIIYYSIIIISGIVISSNLTTIGGLLIFSLVINPASAALQIAYSLRGMCILASIFGVSSCLLGLWFSFIFNVPTGAVIIIFSSLVFLVCLLVSPKKRWQRLCCSHT